MSGPYEIWQMAKSLFLNEYKKMQSDLSEAIRQLDSKLRVIKIDKILSAMGFPINWQVVEQKDMK